SSRRGTPPVAGAAEGLLAERRCAFVRASLAIVLDGPAPSEVMRRSAGGNLSMHLPQGACLASGGGGRWGRDQRHGERKSGSCPQLSLHRPRSGPASSASEPGVRGRHVPASAHSLPVYSTSYRNQRPLIV